MADVVKLGIGLETAQAQNNAKQLTNQLDNISKGAKRVDTSAKSMTASMLKAQVAFEAAKMGARFLADQFTAAIQTGAQFEQQMANVKAVSGATEQQFKDLENAALKMGKTTSFSASESASALEAMSKAGFATSESIAALDEVLQLSAASGMALGESANLITNIMSSMGVKVEDLTHVNNVLVKTFTSTNTTLQGLGKSFEYAGGIAATTGVEIEWLSALFGVLGNAGIDASRGGTAATASMSRLVKPTREAQEAMKALGVEVGNNLPVTLRALEKQGATTKDMITIFGQEAGAALSALGQAGGVGAVDKLRDSLKDVGDVAEKLAKDQLNTLNGDLKLLDSAIENVRIVVFKENNEALRGAIQAVTEVVNNSEGSLIKIGEVLSDLIKYFVGMSGAAKNSGEALDEIIPLVKALASGVAIVGWNFKQLSNAFFGVYSAAKKLKDGEISGGIKELVKWTMRGKDDIESLKTAIENIWTDTVKINKEANEEAKKNAEINRKAKEILEQQSEAIKKNNIDARENIKIHEESAKAIIKHKSAIEDYNNTSEKFSQRLHEDSLRRKSDAQIEAYIHEQLLKPELEHTITIFEDYTDKEKEKTIATNQASEAINNQASQLDRVTEATKKATEETIKFADANARALGTGTVLGSMGGLVGSTFSVPTGGSRGGSVSPSSVTAGISTNTGQSTIRNQLAQMQQLQQQILDYVGSQQSLDIQLADAEQELRNISVELGRLQKDELEKRLQLSKDYFDVSKEIDSLQSEINQEELSHLNTLDGLLNGISADYRELTQGDFAQLIPTEKLAALETEFKNIANAVDSIDFSEITSADKQLISQFQNVSKEFLTQAESVFASSENYQIIKNNVKSEFEELSNGIAQAMGGAKASVDFLGNSSDSAAGKVNSLSNKTIGLGNSANEATGKTDSLSNATQNAGFGADALNATIGGSASNFTNMTGNLNALLANLNTTVTAVTQKFASMGQAITAGETITGGTVPTLEQPTTLAKQWSDFIIAQDYAGRYQLKATANTGDTAVLGATTYGYNVTDEGSTASIYNEQLKRQDQFEIINGQVYKNGTALSLARGAWRINGNNTAANLHDGEMVIRSSDAPAVRSMMRQSGMSDSYGVTSSSSGQQPSMAQNRVVELLVELVELMQNGLSPVIKLNGRTVNEELDRQRALAI